MRCATSQLCSSSCSFWGDFVCKQALVKAASNDARLLGIEWYAAVNGFGLGLLVHDMKVSMRSVNTPPLLQSSFHLPFVRPYEVGFPAISPEQWGFK